LDPIHFQADEMAAEMLIKSKDEKLLRKARDGQEHFSSGCDLAW